MRNPDNLSLTIHDLLFPPPFLRPWHRHPGHVDLARIGRMAGDEKRVTVKGHRHFSATR
jgi:hypothetical protein